MFFFWIIAIMLYSVSAVKGMDEGDPLHYHNIQHNQKIKHATLKTRADLCASNSNREFRLPKEKGPVVVEFSAYVVDINSINVEDMDFRVDIFVRQQWNDSRLNATSLFQNGDEYVTRPPEYIDYLWQPDPYILNSKVSEIAVLSQKLSSVTIFRNHTVRYVARMHAIVACQMDFQLYPMDIQVCPMYIESFSHNNEQIKLKWGDTGVTVNTELKLLQYYMDHKLKLEEADGTTFKRPGNFSRLIIYFRFERQIGHHLIQTFAPSTLVVALSWFSFWIGLDAIPGRMTLLVTSMLTLVLMFRGLKSDIPPVAYVKALDVWMAGCMIFVFAALAEFVVVKVLNDRYQNQLKRNKNNPLKIFPLIMTSLQRKDLTTWAQHNGRIRCHPTTPRSRFKLNWVDSNGEHRILTKEVDRVSRTVFPLVFLCFVCIYWPILLWKNSQL